MILNKKIYILFFLFSKLLISHKTIYFQNRTKTCDNPQNLTVRLNTIPSGIGGPARHRKIEDFVISYENPEKWYEFKLEGPDENAVALTVQAPNSSLGYKPSDIMWSPVYTPVQVPVPAFANAPIEDDRHFIISWDDTLPNKLRIDY